MFQTFCLRKLQEFSETVSHQQALMLFICVLNVFFSIVATLRNIVVIHALWKASSIPANLKKLFLSLAFSDLAMGFTQPMYCAILAVRLNMAADGNHGWYLLCPFGFTMVAACMGFVVGASFFTIAAIALDRYFALFPHLRYQGLVTKERVDIALVILWLTSGVATFFFLALPDHNDMVAVVFESAGLLVITVAYFRIYKVAQYHQNQIQYQNQFQNDEALDVAGTKKSALNAFCVYIVSLFCYLPNILASILLKSIIRQYYTTKLVQRANN